MGLSYPQLSLGSRFYAVVFVHVLLYGCPVFNPWLLSFLTARNASAELPFCTPHHRTYSISMDTVKIFLPKTQELCLMIADCWTYIATLYSVLCFGSRSP